MDFFIKDVPEKIHPAFIIVIDVVSSGEGKRGLKADFFNFEIIDEIVENWAVAILKDSSF
jgi:hypothetical protein